MSLLRNDDRARRELARGDLDSAGASLSEALKSANCLPANERSDLACEAAFFAGVLDQDRTRALAWLAICQSLPVPDPDAHCRARLAAAGTPDAFNHALEEARGLLDQSPDRGVALMYREILDGLPEQH